MSQLPFDVITIASLAVAIFVLWRLGKLQTVSRWDWGLYWAMLVAMAAVMGVILFTEARETPFSELVLACGSLALSIAILLLARSLWRMVRS